MRRALEENKAWRWTRSMESSRGCRRAGYSIFKIDWSWKPSICKYLKTDFEVRKEASSVDI